MSEFKDFIDSLDREVEKHNSNSELNLSSIQESVVSQTAIAIGSLAIFSNREKEKFSQEVSALVRNPEFLSELGNRVDKPLEEESEDEFVERSSDQLRKMLYEKFNIKQKK